LIGELAKLFFVLIGEEEGFVRCESVFHGVLGGADLAFFGARPRGVAGVFDVGYDLCG
jgi:hypothetical protein